MTATIEPFYDDRTSTLTYVVFDKESRDAVVIDPVLDYDPGALPSANDKGQRYLRIPINAFRPEQDAPIDLEEI